MITIGRWGMSGGGGSLGSCLKRVYLPCRPLPFFSFPNPAMNQAAFLCWVLTPWCTSSTGAQSNKIIIYRFWDLWNHELQMNFSSSKSVLSCILVMVMKKEAKNTSRLGVWGTSEEKQQVWIKLFIKLTWSANNVEKKSNSPNSYISTHSKPVLD